MELSQYNEKHVRVTDKYGNTFTGVAVHCCSDYGLHEFNREEESISVGDYLLFTSDIASVEEIEVHGTAELWTQRLVLRRFCPEDAPALYLKFGADEAMYEYSGWNPYATAETARQAVQRYIAGYDNPRFYAWAIDYEGVLLGTIGAYDYIDNQIEVGFSIARACWGRGYATEALKAVLDYLTGNENMTRVTAWCASENIGSRRAMEKAGMRTVSTEKDGLAVGGRVYDKTTYEFRRGS